MTPDLLSLVGDLLRLLPLREGYLFGELPDHVLVLSEVFPFVIRLLLRLLLCLRYRSRVRSSKDRRLVDGRISLIDSWAAN